MKLTRRGIVIVTCVLAVAAFAIVQDRVTAAGARRYAATQREAIAVGRAGITIESVMAPAIRRSVWWASGGAAVVLLAGLGAAALVRPRT